MEQLIRQAMVCTKRLANIAINSDLDDEQQGVITQSVANGQIIVQGLFHLQKLFDSGEATPEDEFLVSYFKEQAESYLSQTSRFIAELDAINHA